MSEEPGAADPKRPRSPPPRLRARRIPVDPSTLGSVRASARHLQAGVLEGEVHDLSQHGLALRLAQPDQLPQLLLSGDRLEELTITWGGRLLFRGCGLLRRVGEEGEGLVLGVELEGDGLDLSELHRSGARQSFAQRWQQLEAQLHDDELSPEFKAFVADARSFLERARSFLDAEEHALRAEDRLTREQALQLYLEELGPRLVEEMEAARIRLGELVAGLPEADHPRHRAYLKLHLAPLLRASPFMRRCLDKPLGYAGDYEMMNMLYREHAEGETLFGKALNLYATRELAAQANINRIEYLGAKIRAVAKAAGSRPIRVASIGCGPARELAAVLEANPELGPQLDVALIDQEERSIAFCERTLSPVAVRTGARIQFIRESIRRLLTTRQLSVTLGARDLIYSAGLFDYLGDRSFGALLSVLHDGLVPGGSLVVGNVAAHNPSRWTMEYYSEWFLHHRSPDDLRRLAAPLHPAPSRLDVEAEPTGVNLFLTILR